MSKKIRAGIIWADPYNTNLGVSALGYSSLSLISAAAQDKNTDIEFVFLGSSGRYRDQIEINNRIFKCKNLVSCHLKSPKSILKLLLKPRQIFDILFLNRVFDITAGDSFADIYGLYRFNKMLATKQLFSKLGTPQLLMPQTIGPFSDPVNERKAFKAMSAMVKVIGRDRQSYDYAAKFLPADKVMESIDVAFYLPFEKQEFDHQKVNVGINISGLLWHGGYTKNNQFDLKSDYQSLMRSILSFFAAQPDVQIHLVSHVVSKNATVESDCAVAELLKKEFPGSIIAPRFKSPIEAKSYISGMDFFTGARMHACIGAFSSGTPVFPLAYSRKFNGLFIDTLKYRWIGDCVNEDNQTILANIKDAFAKRDTLKTDIDTSNRDIVRPRLETLKAVLGEFIMSR